VLGRRTIHVEVLSKQSLPRDRHPMFVKTTIFCDY
jgi:hypothetical protein